MVGGRKRGQKCVVVWCSVCVNEMIWIQRPKLASRVHVAKGNLKGTD